MPTLILVRHGQCEKNVMGIVNHDHTKSYHLTPKGREQAAHAGVILKDVPFTHAFVSRFPRTQETAQLILGDRALALDIDERLDEIDNGVYEGEPIATYREEIRDRVHETPDGGETWQVFKNRMGSFLNDARKMQGTILVVSHGHPIAALHGLINGWDDHKIEVTIPKQGEVVSYEFPDG